MVDSEEGLGKLTWKTGIAVLMLMVASISVVSMAVVHKPKDTLPDLVNPVPAPDDQEPLANAWRNAELKIARQKQKVVVNVCDDKECQVGVGDYDEVDGVKTVVFPSRLLDGRGEVNITVQMGFESYGGKIIPYDVPGLSKIELTTSDDIGVEDPEERVGYAPPEGVVSATAHPRSPLWRGVRDAYAKAHPKCEFNGCDGKFPIAVHHVIPFHVDPNRELDPNNLISACSTGYAEDGTPSPNHHLFAAHRGKYSNDNPLVREQFANGQYTPEGQAASDKHFAALKKKASSLPKTTQTP